MTKMLTYLTKIIQKTRVIDVVAFKFFSIHHVYHAHAWYVVNGKAPFWFFFHAKNHDELFHLLKTIEVHKRNLKKKMILWCMHGVNSWQIKTWGPSTCGPKPQRNACLSRDKLKSWWEWFLKVYLEKLTNIITWVYIQTIRVYRNDKFCRRFKLLKL